MKPFRNFRPETRKEILTKNNHLFETILEKHIQHRNQKIVKASVDSFLREVGFSKIHTTVEPTENTHFKYTSLQYTFAREELGEISKNSCYRSIENAMNSWSTLVEKLFITTSVINIQIADNQFHWKDYKVIHKTDWLTDEIRKQRIEALAEELKSEDLQQLKKLKLKLRFQSDNEKVHQEIDELTKKAMNAMDEKYLQVFKEFIAQHFEKTTRQIEEEVKKPLTTKTTRELLLCNSSILFDPETLLIQTKIPEEVFK